MMMMIVMMTTRIGMEVGPGSRALVETLMLLVSTSRVRMIIITNNNSGAIAN